MCPLKHSTTACICSLSVCVCVCACEIDINCWGSYALVLRHSRTVIFLTIYDVQLKGLITSKGVPPVKWVVCGVVLQLNNWSVCRKRTETCHMFHCGKLSWGGRLLTAGESRMHYSLSWVTLWHAENHTNKICFCKEVQKPVKKNPNRSSMLPLQCPSAISCFALNSFIFSLSFYCFNHTP